MINPNDKVPYSSPKWRCHFASPSAMHRVPNAPYPCTHFALIWFFFFSCPNPSSNRCVLVTQLCLTLCDCIDCSLPGSSAHGILQARILEWVSMSFSRESSQPTDWTWVSCIAGRFFIIWATKEALSNRYIVWSHCSFILHLLNDW